MNPALLGALAADVDVVAQRLITLRTLLPGADLGSIVSQRPGLLLEGEWGRVAGAVGALRGLYGEAGMCEMVTEEPLLLVEDVEGVLEEVAR
jgi:hypothetical protein